MSWLNTKWLSWLVIGWSHRTAIHLFTNIMHHIFYYTGKKTWAQETLWREIYCSTSIVETVPLLFVLINLLLYIINKTKSKTQVCLINSVITTTSQNICPIESCQVCTLQWPQSIAWLFTHSYSVIFDLSQHRIQNKSFDLLS